MLSKLLTLITHPIASSKKIIPFIQTKRYFAQMKKDARNQHTEYARLKSAYTTYTPLLLHIGCGPRVLPGWVNIDLSFVYSKKDASKDFFAFNMIEMGLPLPDHSVDGIFHEDFIEHLDQKEQVIFLAETFRVLKPGAIHRINTPDLIGCVARHSDFQKGKKGVFVSEWDQWGHVSILTPNYLTELAHMVGYTNVQFTKRNNSASPHTPPELRPGDDRAEDSNLFADLTK